LFDTSTFAVSLLLETFLALFAIVTNVLFVVLLWKCRLIHLNVRILLGNQSACALLAAAYIVAKSAYTLWQIAGKTNFSISAYECQMTELIYMVPMQVVARFVLVIAIDRALALSRHSTYHIIKWYYTIVIVPIVWMIAVICAGVNFYYSMAETLPFCVAVLLSPPIVLYLHTIGNMLLELVAVLLFVLVLVHSRKELLNFYINQAQLSLRSRLQLRRNMELTETLLPSVILHAATHFTIFITMIITQANDESSLDSKIILLQYFAYAPQVFLIGVHPLCCVLKSSRLRNELRTMLLQDEGRRNLAPAVEVPSMNPLGSMSPVGSEGQDEAELRFQSLQLAWDAQFECRKKSKLQR